MKKENFAIAGLSALLFLALIFLVKTYDVAPIGAAGTSIGLSTLNGNFHDFTGVHQTLYDITNILGYMSIAAVGIFGFVGLVQWIMRKELLKVDREILAMGILFVVVLLLYIFFEKVIVNYRPVIMPGESEPAASFPSSHTMMTVTVMGSVFMVIKKYIKNTTVCRIIQLVAALVMVFMVVGRLACGIHWLTDIFGAILLSITLLEIFYATKD